MESIIIRTKKEIIKVRFDAIYCIVSHPIKPHYILLITKEGNYELYQKLQTLEKAYPEDLIRCHRNCLVNLSKIKSVCLQEKTIFLGDNREHKVIFSRRRYQQIIKKWLAKGG